MSNFYLPYDTKIATNDYTQKYNITLIISKSINCIFVMMAFKTD